jgi:hypothetical protein
MATPDPLALTEAYRLSQARRAAAIAALVAYYYRNRVNVQDQSSVRQWINLMLPKIMAEHDWTARRAATYGNAIRQLEVGSLDGHRFEPTVGAIAEQVERSLMFVGPGRHLRKITEVREMDLPPVSKAALIADAREEAATAIAGSTMRHVQNGGRQTLYDNILEDPEAMGYIRVTRANPCYFCAMLASRGIVFGEDSFDESDPRFTGKGTAKVHDNCYCALKPVYGLGDPLLINTANFEALWWLSDGTANGFRRLYEGRDPDTLLVSA